eukprot:8322297-Pyramimonas_sp.AAC.1
MYGAKHLNEGDYCLLMPLGTDRSKLAPSTPITTVELLSGPIAPTFSHPAVPMIVIPPSVAFAPLWAFGRARARARAT